MEHEHDSESVEAFVAPPTWPKVIGIICVGFASLGLCCGGLGAVMSPFMGNVMASQLNGDPLPPSMQFDAIDYTLAGLGIGLSSLLLAGGILLIGRRPLGRTLALFYTLPSIATTLVNITRGFAKQAATEQWARDFPNNEMAQALNSGNPAQQLGPWIGLAIGLLLGVGFPLFLFVWFAAVKTKPVQITGTEEGVY
ncbi:MAG: hypothetical protein AB8F26_00705 [Phycisphaerales bacterium]